MSHNSEQQKQVREASRQWLSRQDWRVVLILVFAIIVVSFPIYYYRVMFPTDNDYGLHLLYTRYLLRLDFKAIPATTLSHPGLQLVLASLYWITIRKVPLGLLLVCVLVAAQAATATIIYGWLGDQNKRGWNPARAITAATLTLAAPIMLLALKDGFFYYGYIGLANYHNPSILLLQPVALTSFILASRAFNMSRSSWKVMVAAGLLVAISALVKPNYLLSVLPVLGVMLIWRYLRKQPCDYRLLLYGYITPGLLILFVQWLTAFTPVGGAKSQILFSPLAAENTLSSFLLPKFFLSILFPAGVLILYFRKIRQEHTVALAWLGFVVGAAQMYLLAESGSRLADNNFIWSAQIMLFLLFVVSARFLLVVIFDHNAGSLWKKVLLIMVYLAHYTAGIIYYIHCFTSIHYG